MAHRRFSDRASGIDTRRKEARARAAVTLQDKANDYFTAEEMEAAAKMVEMARLEMGTHGDHEGALLSRYVAKGNVDRTIERLNDVDVLAKRLPLNRDSYDRLVFDRDQVNALASEFGHLPKKIETFMATLAGTERDIADEWMQTQSSFLKASFLKQAFAEINGRTGAKDGDTAVESDTVVDMQQAKNRRGSTNNPRIGKHESGPREAG